MGCTPSVSALARKKNSNKSSNIPEIAIFVPSMRVPLQSDLQRPLRGLIPKHLADRIVSLRNRIVFIAEDTGGSAVTELQRAMEDYLPLLLGLTKIDHSFQPVLEFKWKILEDGRQEVCVANCWFEILCVIHMMAMLTLTEANSMLIPKHRLGSSERLVSADCDCMRDAVDLLLKASGYLEFCVRNVLVRLPHDIKQRFPEDLQEGVLEAVSIQALGQGTEIQLGLAAESQYATLPVKRRLACEQLSYYGQAHYCLSECGMGNGYGNKHLLFIKWKYLEAKAAAYYYHGLIVDKGSEPSCHVSAVCCFLAAEELLSESKKACLSFCLAVPVTRAPPLWGVMKHLSKKIPEVASKKSQVHGHLLDQEKGLQVLPDLPEFQLSLRPDDYQLPEMDSAWGGEEWEIPTQPLKDHLKDWELDETEN
ncbi:uncharacterized protein LOC127803951 [Diospyros lotus]|uniref:uncharacterized protein LOC127803951 n=1 Tax=Diospyros lotus TaxID=55363 RepID=UPI00224D6E1C|nr:uncharacterized protein LOC127803951 [Diospyros lotus]XP_052196582.1 uncharacterized protein LOC127803951 [Diospyros lotus]